MANIALLNTVFRAIIVLLLTPFIGLLEKLVNILVKDKNEKIVELEDAEKLEDRFQYSSDNNTVWLSVEEIRKALKEVDIVY